MPAAVEKTISANILMFYYDKFAGTYTSDYPEVKNPAALLEGITSITQAIGGGVLPSHTLLYILEDEQDRIDPLSARYIMTITKDISKSSLSDNFAIRLFYTGTGEMESISTIEEEQVVWSPDNLENSKHQTRTKYYLGFVYMLCDKSPGFDEEVVADTELTLEDLIALGIEGELPSELIEISLDTEQQADEEVAEPVQAVITDTTDHVVVSEFDDLEHLFDEESAEIAVPEQDDTEVVLYTPEEYEEEFNDLATDYEELFDDEMFES